MEILKVATLLILPYIITPFNLDYKIPVVKRGNLGTYFGYSVAEHQEVNKGSWLLVGAPKDRNLQSGTSSGALWKCLLTTSMNDCQQVVTDGRRSIDDNSLKVPGKDEDLWLDVKEDLWLTVRSQGIGGKISVCAHRILEGSHFGQVLCYILNNNFDYYDNVQIGQEQEEFGYCQIGTSSAFLDDGILILGSSGPDTWCSTLFVLDTNKTDINRNKKIYNVPVINETIPIKNYSYLGMSVTGGKFFGPELSVVWGATRSNGTGQVVFFSKEVNVSLTISGEQFASSFGHAVCTLDLNGDGKPDLAVGAPFYFDRESGGSVYIYINENYSIKQKFDFKLTGKSESSFGFAISSAGDLNKDGCDDLAIGSPYEGGGVVYIFMGNRNTGLDREPKQIIRAEMLSFIIPQLKTFGYSLSGGMDLDENGYPDLLVGAYHEDTVMLFRGRPIIDIKTELINHDSLSKINASKQGCAKDHYSNKTCFSFDICFTIDALPPKFTGLSLNYAIEAETWVVSKTFSRVYFDSNSLKESRVIKEIELTKNRSTSCSNHTVYIKENTRDTQSPIKFQVNYRLVQNDPEWIQQGPLLSMDNLPILNATEEGIFRFDALFLRDCGNDGICKSDLSLNASFNLPTIDGKDNEYDLLHDQEAKLLVNVDNLGEPAYETRIFVFHSGLSYDAAKQKDKNVICSVINETFVSCPLGNPFINQMYDLDLRFVPKAVEFSEKYINFHVWVNTTSSDVRAQQKYVSIKLKMKRSSNVVNRINLNDKKIVKPMDPSMSLSTERFANSQNSISSSVVWYCLTLIFISRLIF